MSIQLEALADEVFEAATAQARLGGVVARQPFGLVVRHPEYPDLFFLNGISGLIAPDWSVSDLETVVRDLLPDAPQVRVESRDPKTIASLSPGLATGGYRHEVRVAMVHVFEDVASSPARGGELGRGFSIGEVAEAASWSDFEASLRTDSREHEWTEAMVEQYIRLCRWRAANTPHHYHLLYDGSQRLAHVGLFQYGRTIYLHALYTRPDARWRGAGSALTQAMVGESQRLGGDRLVLQAAADGRLPGYYTRLGYRPVGRQHIWTRAR